MYKYLYDKLEQTKGGATINGLVFIPSEALRESKSEVFEDFTELEDEEICEVLNWKAEKFVFDMIRDEDSSLALSMLENNKAGFLAECHFPECGGFYFAEGSSEPSAWSVHRNICRIEWIYADSMGELVDKMMTISDRLFDEAVTASRKSKELQEG